MKAFTLSRTVRLLFVASATTVGILCSSCQTNSNGVSSGWLRPLSLPKGKDTAWWDAGMSHLKLVNRGGAERLADGSVIEAVECSGPANRIYLWDRISDQYNSPAVASTSPDFGTYATLDGSNRAFLEGVYGQLRVLWGSKPTSTETRLLRKLREEIDEVQRG